MRLLLIFILSIAVASSTIAQCNIALDTLDEFDSTRLIATQAMNLGYLVVSGNVPEDLVGEEYVEEAKAIFSYSNEKKIRSFFLSLGVVERKFHMIEADFNVFLKMSDSTIVSLLNVPADGEFDRDILMWKYLHTCVVPMEVFHMMKHERVEKIRIVYTNFKQTIVLTEAQQLALQEAVKCVELQLIDDPAAIKP